MEPADDEDRREWYRFYQFPPTLSTFRDNIQFCGWACKRKSTIVDHWERRWFVQFNRFLLSFPSHDPTAKVVSAHYLVGSSISTCPDSETGGRPNVLMLSTVIPKKPGGEIHPLILSFQTEEIAGEWEKSLNGVISVPFEPRRFRTIVVGKPQNVQHVLHVTMANSTENGNFGFGTLSPELALRLKQQGFVPEDVIGNEEALISCARFLDADESENIQMRLQQYLKPNANGVAEFSLDDLAPRQNPTSLYKDMNEIDAGSQGKVYRARKVQGGATVAIKKVRLRSDEPLPIVRALAAEVAFLQACDHPNIVKFLGAHRSENEVWLVMEFMGGGKLTDLIEKKIQFTEKQIARIMREVLSGLQYLHAGNCMHRDIKSDNVLLSNEGHIKLGDFGFAATLSTSIENKRKTVVGTPYWMAPEVVQAVPYDMKADIWSVGILLIELCDGLPPFMNYPPLKALSKIVTSPPPMISAQQRARFSDVCHDFLRRTVMKSPALRPTAGDLLQHPFVQPANCAEGTTFIVDMLKMIR